MRNECRVETGKDAEKEPIIYEYPTKDIAVRFAKKDTVIPNIELNRNF